MTVLCVFLCSLGVVPELTLPTNTSRQRLTKLINVGARGRSKSRIMSRYEPPRGKTNNVVFDQVQHKPACTSTEKS